MADNVATPVTTSNGKSYILNNWATHLIDPSQKDAAWGYNVFVANKQYLKTIYGGWYNGSAALVRSYANGTQNPDIYRTVFDPQNQNAQYFSGAIGDRFAIAPVIPVLRSRVLAELDNIPLEVSCEAVDEMANSQRNLDKMRLSIQKDLDNKLAQLSQKMGYDKPITSGFDKKILTNPIGGGQAIQGGMGADLSNSEELDIYMDKNSGYYNQSIELANEIAIQSIFQYNEFDKLMTLLKQDSFDLGICCYRCFINSYTGLPQFQYIDVSQLYIMGSKLKDFSDSPFWYAKVPATLADILTYFGDKITEQEAKDIWEHSAKRRPPEWNDRYPAGYSWDWRKWDMNSLLKIEIDAYYFEVKTNDVVTYEASTTKTGSTKRKKKNINYEPPEESQYNKTKENYWSEQWYSGFYIQGLTKVYKWEKLYNQQREDFNPQKSHSSLNIYRFSEKGLTEQVIAFADDFQTTFLKRKHMIVKALPHGYSFNWDALSELEGTAGTLTKEKLIEMYLQTGSTIHRSMNDMGEPILANANSPHMELGNGIDPNIVRYTEVMQELKNEIASTFGIPPIDASVNPDPKTLVGVQQSAQQASINSRHFLFVGFQKLIEQTAKRVSCLLQEIAVSNPTTWETIKMMVGNVNASVIESMDELPLHKFGIFAKNVPTESEKNDFRKFVMDAYSKGQVGLDDVLSIWWVKNLKLSVAMLNLKMKKKMAMQQQMQMQQMQMQQQGEQQLLQMKMMIEKMHDETLRANTDGTGRYMLLDENLKQQGDFSKKLLQEITKIHLAQEKMGHEKNMADIQNLADKSNMDYQTNLDHATIDKQMEADHQTIDKQSEADIALEKATPTPKAA